MSAPPQVKTGIVKQVVSGDSIIIRGYPKGGPPPERQINLASVIAPKLARRVTTGIPTEENKDEPFAWESREYLRQKIIGKEISFLVEYKAPSGREYGCVYLGKDPATSENLTESLINEGLVSVRREGIRPESEKAKWIDLEESAKNNGRGKWATTGLEDHIRDIKWSTENPRAFVDRSRGKPFKAVIEHVRDGSTVRAFLLPDFHYVTIMISGIRCPGYKLDNEGKPDPSLTEPLAEEARFFTESRLLQRDVEVILESVNNTNFVGSVIHPNGNIAEFLLNEGFARCVDWSMALVSGGAEKLRAAEKAAKESKLKIWKSWTPVTPQISTAEKEFSGKVVEVINADALVLKLADGLALKKVFLASIRPPRLSEDKSSEQRPKGFRPLYDIPWMYEAREFLRKKLVGKKVNAVVDYIQSPSLTFPEKVCCTVTVAGVNVAEAMVSKGLATVVRYKQDDDQRSSHYDELLAAEVKAEKSLKGVHAKKEIPMHRVVDLSGDVAQAKKFLPFLQRAGRTEAVAEFVASGSRFRLYMPKESRLITFLLGGITCPRPTRPTQGGGTIEGEEWGEEALVFSKELCHQREVEVEVETMDKAGNFIGWLWIEGKNLSVALVEEGFATVHFSAERSVHFRQLQIAEDSAKSRKDKIWLNFNEVDEEKERIEEDKVLERKVDYKTVVVTEITTSLRLYAQMVDQGPQLENLMEQIRREFASNPPLTGAFTPKRGDICAAKFVDGDWYRAKVEKIIGSNAHVYYIDYGNREVVPTTSCASLPSAFSAASAYAKDYGLACVLLPPTDTEVIPETLIALSQETSDHQLLLNVEYRAAGIDYVTLCDVETKEDIVKRLVSEGLLRVENRREKRFRKLVDEYKAAEDLAKKDHLNMWMYGDVTEDDAKEFGLGPSR